MPSPSLLSCKIFNFIVPIFLFILQFLACMVTDRLMHCNGRLPLTILPLNVFSPPPIQYFRSSLLCLHHCSLLPGLPPSLRLLTRGIQMSKAEGRGGFFPSCKYWTSLHIMLYFPNIGQILDFSPHLWFIFQFPSKLTSKD